MKRLNIVGNVFGKLTVDKFVGLNGRQETVWECACLCGNKRHVSGRRLTTGRVISCGCTDTENRSKSQIKHGRSVGGIRHHSIRFEEMLKAVYNISVEYYANLRYVEQKDLCACCGTNLSELKHPLRAVVDHDHDSGNVCGITCDECNKVEGQYKKLIETEYGTKVIEYHNKTRGK